MDAITGPTVVAAVIALTFFVLWRIAESEILTHIRREGLLRTQRALGTCFCYTSVHRDSQAVPYDWARDGL